MKKAIVWAALWTILALTGTYYLLRGSNEVWFDIVLTLASFCLACIYGVEVRNSQRRENQS